MSRSTPSKLRTRLLALTISSAVSLSLLWLLFTWFSEQRSSEELAFVQPDLDSVAEARAERQPPPDDPHDPHDPTSFRYHLSEDEAKRVYNLGVVKGDKRIYDPWSGFLAKPNRNRLTPWEEHPDGEFLSETNLEGLFDGELNRDAPDDVRIIAAGDSHTFGLCNAEESWAQPLGSIARERVARQNGRGAQYRAGRLHLLQLRGDAPEVPRVGARRVRPRRVRGKRLQRAPGPGLRLRRSRANGAAARAVQEEERGRGKPGTGPNGPMLQFSPRVRGPTRLGRGRRRARRRPRPADEGDLRSARHPLRAGRDSPPCCMDWSGPPHDFAAIREFLELAEDDCTVADDLIERFLHGTRDLGLTPIDLRQAYGQLPSPPYWKRDLHLDLEGHRALAEQLLPIVLAGIELPATPGK